MTGIINMGKVLVTDLLNICASAQSHWHWSDIKTNHHSGPGREYSLFDLHLSFRSVVKLDPSLHSALLFHSMS